MSQAFLDRQRQRLEQNLDAEFYDITAWSLPLAYNLRTWVAAGDVAADARPLAEAAGGIQRRGGPRLAGAAAGDRLLPAGGGAPEPARSSYRVALAPFSAGRA